VPSSFVFQRFARAFRSLRAEVRPTPRSQLSQLLGSLVAILLAGGVLAGSAAASFDVPAGAVAEGALRLANPRWAKRWAWTAKPMTKRCRAGCAGS